jgi:hypothetical protein
VEVGRGLLLPKVFSIGILDSIFFVTIIELYLSITIL